MKRVILLITTVTDVIMLLLFISELKCTKIGKSTDMINIMSFMRISHIISVILMFMFESRDRRRNRPLQHQEISIV
jgi:hypothetical protein